MRRWCRVRVTDVSPLLTVLCAQLWAVGLVSMWRRRGRVPHAVESTAQLKEISAYDPGRGMPNTSLRSENELRLSYSLCVVRAVNGLVDPQQQSYFAGSVLALAAKIGIPGWIVELRHDATHSDLPSLSVLRTAVQSLLLWYEHNYWLEQAEHLRQLSRSVMISGPEDIGESQSERKSRTLTSFSSIIIPHLINDIIFFEQDLPTDKIVLNLLERKVVADVERWKAAAIRYFETCRWRSHVDELLQQAPVWGGDCLIGHAMSRAFSLLCGMNATADENNVKSNELRRWKAAVMCSLAAYVIHNNTCTEYEFTATIYRCNQFEVSVCPDYMVPCLDVCRDVSQGCTDNSDKIDCVLLASSSRGKDITSDITNHCSSNHSRDFTFLPVVWPLGSMPGSVELRLYEADVATVTADSIGH